MTSPPLLATRAKVLALACLVCALPLGLATGSVHAPFPSWTTGEVKQVDEGQKIIEICEDASQKPLRVRWDGNTRFWKEPVAHSDRGTPFYATNVVLGDPVRLMFKRYSDHNLVTRVIRRAPDGAAARAKKSSKS